MTIAADEPAVREFLKALSDLARKSLNGHAAPGLLQLSQLHPRAKNLAISRYPLDDVDGMVGAAIAAAESGQNAFIEGRLISLGASKRGKFEDTACVFALVVDSDADKNAAWTPPPGIKPTIVIETSPGNYQYWFFFREAIHRDRARALGKRIHAATRTDSDTGNPAQPYRIAATTNYPNAAKTARGRFVVGVGAAVCDPTAVWTPEALEAAFPRRARGTQGGGRGPQGAGDIDVDAPGFLAELREVIVNGVPTSHRSRVFYWVVKAFRDDKHTVDEIFDCLSRYPDGIARKYLDPRESGSPQRLRINIQAVYDKTPHPRDWPSGLAKALAAAWGSAQASAPPPPQPPPPVSALADVVAVFRKWLALEDGRPVAAALGAVAANLLEGDPVWLGLVGPPSSAKTELLNSLSALPRTHIVETLSPAGLLSGTPRRTQAPAATGGVLHKIGNGGFGLLLFKDFGSLLSLRHETRSEMMSALRRIYDGEYTRQLGTDGGVTLAWRGKAGCLFGSTQGYDGHHAVVGTLGDRFQLFRVGAMGDEQLEKCRSESGERALMRLELTRTVAGLFASLPDPLPAPEKMTDLEYNALAKTVRLAIKLRAAVVRDGYRREITDVHDPEGPARLIIALQQQFTGLVLIGVERSEACAILDRMTLDSTPRLRLKAYRGLTDDWLTTGEIAAMIKLPFITVQRALEELTAQKVALHSEQSKSTGRGVLVTDCWKLHP
jgi:hypothetical protein